MNSRAAYFLIVGAPVATLVSAVWMNNWFCGRAEALVVRHRQETAEMAKQWQAEELDRKLAANEATLQRSREFQRQLEAAWGGPREAVWKNPDLTIVQMLEQLGRTCAPAGTMVGVRVDSFTEFEVNFNLPGPPEGNQIAQIGLCLLQHGAPYLRNIRFTTAGSIVGELDDVAIDSVSNWATASVADAEKILNEPAIERKPNNEQAGSGSGGWATEFAAKVKEITGEAGDSASTSDGNPLRQSQRAFDQVLNERNQQLKAVLQSQDSASKLSDVYSLDDLQAKLRSLNQNETVLAGLRDFFLNQEKEFERLLKQAQLDPLLVSIETRGMSERQAHRRAALQQLFQAMTERQRSATAFLTDMQRTWGSWKPRGDMIQFSSPEAQTVYRQASSQLQQATEQLNSAMRLLPDG